MNGLRSISLSTLTDEEKKVLRMFLVIVSGFGWLILLSFCGAGMLFTIVAVLCHHLLTFAPIFVPAIAGAWSRSIDKSSGRAH